MKLIIHIGTGKTGTTSIQSALSSNIKLLEGENISYPFTESGEHNIIEAALLPFEKLHRVFRSRYNDNPQLPKDLALKLIHNLNKQTSEHIIISGEFFFSLEVEPINQLLNLLNISANDVTVICYVRNPSSFWLSGIQQFLKGSSNIEGLIEGKYRFRKGLENWSKVVGDQNMIIRPFDKKQLHDGDVVLDFMQQIYAVTGSKFQFTDVKNQNASVFAEQCILMQELRIELLSVPENTFNDDSRLLIRSINIESRNMELSKMKFKNNVVRFIESNHYDDALWLEQNFGITIYNQENMELMSTNTEQGLFSTGLVRDLLDNYNNEKLELLKNRVIERFNSM